MKPRGGEGQNSRLKCPLGFLVAFCVSITLCGDSYYILCKYYIMLRFLLRFALVLHNAAILITFCVSITLCGDSYYILC